MSLRAIYSAGTGMEAHQFSLDTVANNIANASSTAFKRSRANFEDTFYENIALPGAQTAGGGLTPVGTHVGLGTRIQSTSVEFKQGSPQVTNGDLDVAIMGEGFFQVTDGTGVAYTRAGNFTLNSDRNIVLASALSGHLLQPAIQIPQGAMDVAILPDGTVTYKDVQQQIVTAGQVQLWDFPNKNGLLQKGENLFIETPASGGANSANPGTNGMGALTQGSLEVSNVEPVHELVDLIKTQRNFELNSQIIQAADQMLQLVANLRRF